jgi:dolichol-phosphate mannosyltransferase
MSKEKLMSSASSANISVVIPAYKVTDHILQVINKIGQEVSNIYVVDDCCPDNSGELVRRNCSDPRVFIIRNEINLGVGGAVMAGYQAAIAAGADVIVKVDGDGQMDPQLIPYFCAPIIDGKADYTKGNRFFDLTHIGQMPFMRIFGNAVLSFMAKLSSGYWNIFDPTNGYTAISARVAAYLPMDKISQRYFFETDMLFRLNTLRAVVADVPMNATYGDEKSNLKISKIIGEFLFKHMRNFGKRIFYNYFLRDVTVASFELITGSLLFGFGAIFGVANWLTALSQHTYTPLGTIMLAALPILTGLQLLLAFLNYDIASVPSHPVSRSLAPRLAA